MSNKSDFVDRKSEDRPLYLHTSTLSPAVFWNSGDGVMVNGFVKFRVREKDQHRGRNPVTGKDMIMRPRKVVTFKFSFSGKLREKIASQL